MAKHPDLETRRGKNKTAFGKAVRQGQAVSKALLAAGYSPKQASKGMATVRRSAELSAEYQRAVAALTSEVKPPDIRATIARNRLTENAITGEDKAVQSCKLLMQDKEVDILRPDSMSGVVLIEVPTLPTMPNLVDAPLIEALDVKLLR